jgi:hypothetical protein
VIGATEHAREVVRRRHERDRRLRGEGLSAERLRETLECFGGGPPGMGIGAGLPFAAGAWEEPGDPTLTDTTNLQLRLRGDLGITTENRSGTDYLTAIADQSGNGRDYAQATDDQQPQWSGITIGGRQALGLWETPMAGVWRSLVQSAGASIAETTHTIIFLIEFVANATAQQFFLDWQSGRMIFRVDPGVLTIFDGTNRASSTAPTNAAGVAVWQADGASSFCQWDGAETAIGTTVSGTNSGTSSAIGSRYDGANIQAIQNAKIGEVLVYSPAKSSAEIEAIKDNYLNPFWGTTS